MSNGLYKIQKKIYIEEFFKMNLHLLCIADTMNYQEITDALRFISKAKYVAFNLYDDSGEKFITVAISGLTEDIKRAESLLGYDIIGKKWACDPIRAKKIDSKVIAVFPSLNEFAGDVIPESIISMINKEFDIGQVILVKILKDDVFLGDFTLMMPSGVSFKKENYVKLYTRQLGLSIMRKKAEDQLRQNLQFNESVIKVLQYDFKTIAELLEFALNEALAVTKSKLGYISLYNEENRELTLHSWSGSVMEECTITDRHTVYQLDKTGIWGEVIRQRKPLIINDFQTPSLLKNGYPEEHVKLFKYLTVPIFDRDKIVAIVGVANKELDYTESDVSNLTLLLNNVWALLARKKSEELLIKEKELLKATLNSVEYLSYHDQLTGLYNRRFFEEELKRLDTKRNLPISVIMVDLNGLKLANDAFGHDLGDKLLRKTAEILKSSCREDDIIARLGGDEFVVLLPNTSEEQVEQIVNRIVGACSNVKVGSITLSLSYGWEVKKSKDDDINEILKKAENRMYRRKLFESPSMRSITIQTIIQTLYETHKLEEKHSRRVSDLCVAIGKELSFNVRELAELKNIGLLHDIGKIAIDKAILSKTTPLTDVEWTEIKRHPEIGYRILSLANDLSEIAQYVLAHHEHWDGSGYPKGLKRNEIPFKARIILLTDAYDSMTSFRPYCTILPREEAIKQIRDGAGKQFDPKLAKVFVERVLANYTL